MILGGILMILDTDTYNDIRRFHRVPVKFRMQVPEIGSKPPYEEPAVTETTLSPEDDPKMVNYPDRYVGSIL